jgi:hypothetical protein
METKKGDIVKKILEGLLVAGEILVTAMEPRLSLGRAMADFRHTSGEKII